MQVVRAQPRIECALFSAAFIEFPVAERCKLAAQFDARIREIAGNLEQRSKQEIRRLRIQSGDRDQAAQIGEVMDS